MGKARTITPTEMRVVNRSAILDLVRRESPISRSAIAEKLDVSLPTVMRIVDELIEEELVCPLGITEWSGGRRRALLEFNARSQVMVGADLGGGEVYGAAADLAGNVLVERSFPLNGMRGEEAYDRLVDLLEWLRDQAQDAGHRVRGFGVGAPGVTDYQQGIVRWASVLDWRNFPLRKRLVDRLGLPVIVDNDVNLSALGELWFGAEQNVENLVMISVGTGIGAGIVIDGAIYRGTHQSAGEVGYLLPGREFLGQNFKTFGALESMAARAGILDRARRAAAAASAAPPAAVTDVFAAFARGEGWAKTVVQDTADYLAIVVSGLALCLDPDVIVLGGRLSEQAPVLIPLILNRVGSVFPTEVRLIPSALGHRAAVMGAITNVLHQTADFYTLRSMA